MTLDRDNLQELRNKKIGMVFQNFALMPHRSVVDNIAMPLEIRGISKNDRLDAANKILELLNYKVGVINLHMNYPEVCNKE